MTAPDLQFHVDTRPLNRVMRDLVIASGKDADTVVFQQSRLFAEQALKRTPPKTQAQGNRAVERDINRAIGTASESLIRRAIDRNGGHGENIDQEFIRADGSSFRVQWDRAQLDSEGIKEHHQSQRNRRGRVSRTAKRWIVPDKVRAKYVKEAKRRVGRLKAGWLPTLERFGSKKAPQYVSRRHSVGARGSVAVRGIGTGNVASVMRNHAAGAGDIRRQVQDVLRIRLSAMKRDLRNIQSGYAEDVWRGIRARSRARRTR